MRLHPFPSLLLTLSVALPISCGNSSSTPADAGAPTGTSNQQRAEAVCDAALSGLDEHREGFCALAAALGTGAPDAGTPAGQCSQCASGADDSQAEQARMTCTQSALDCPDLSVADVEACLEAAEPVFDSQLPTCEEIDDGGFGAAFTVLATLTTLDDCAEFLACGDLLANLTQQQ